MLVICLVGRRASGKDFLTNHLLEHFRLSSQKAQRYAIADEIKNELCRENPDVDRDRLETDREYKETWRPELIRIGELGRQKDPQWWLRSCWNRIRTSQNLVALVSDVRFVREFAFFKEYATSVLVVKVEASEESRLRRGWVPNTAVDTNATETEFMSIPSDITIENEDGCDVDSAIEQIVAKLDLGQV